MRVALRLLLPMLIVLAACGATDRPVAQNAVALPTPVTIWLPLAAAKAGPVEAVSTAVPVGKRLRDLWPLPQIDPHPVSALVYTAVVPPDDDSIPTASAIWRVDLRDLSQRQQIATFPIDPTAGDDLPYGRIAPDGSAIAYLRQTGDLYLMRPDGSGQEHIASAVPYQADECQPTFLWSPDSAKLAIVNDPQPDITYNDLLTIYDLRTRTLSKPQMLGWTFLAGWSGPNTVLAITATSDDSPRVLEGIDATTQQRQTFGNLPGRVFDCANIAPDQQHIALDLDRPYLFKVATKTFQRSAVVATNAVWNPDSVTTLEITSQRPNIAQVRVLGTDQATTALLAPPNAATPPAYNLLSTASNGRYLVVCAVREVGNNQFLARTLLYDIAADTMQLVLEGPRCARVIGWQ